MIHAIGAGPLVRWDDLAHAIARFAAAHWCAPTRACPIGLGSDRWPPTRPQPWNAWPDAGVRLIGIDTAGIDPTDEIKRLDSHQVIRQRGLRVLENLVLDAGARWRLRTDRPCHG